MGKSEELGKTSSKQASSPKRTLGLGGLAKEFAGWEDVNLDEFNWFEEFPQLKELYGKDYEA